MPFYVGSSKLSKLYYGNTKLQFVYHGDELVFAGIVDLPTQNPIPTTITTQTQVATAVGATYTIYNTGNIEFIIF